MLTSILKYLYSKSLERDQQRAAKKGTHVCMFRQGDVMNLKIIPKCTICMSPLEV